MLNKNSQTQNKSKINLIFNLDPDGVNFFEEILIIKNNVYVYFC